MSVYHRLLVIEHRLNKSLILAIRISLHLFLNGCVGGHFLALAWRRRRGDKTALNFKLLS
jgi:hypothetical protein